MFEKSYKTQGKFTLIDINFNSPEQNESFKEEALVVYAKDEKINQDKPQEAQEKTARSLIFSEFIVKILEVVKGRIKIFALEWNDTTFEK